MRELLLEIWSSIRRNKLRTVLTGFSVAWGIFMLSILLGSGNGLKNGVDAQFGGYATNSIDIYDGHTSMPYKGYEKGRAIRLTNRDIEILDREFDEIDKIAANAWFSGKNATYKEESVPVWLRGATEFIDDIEGIELSEGRFINEQDIEDRRKVVVIDEVMNSLFFKGASPIGKSVNIGGIPYRVIGVKKGDAQRSSSSCYIPLTTGHLIYNANDVSIDNIIFTVNSITTDEQLDSFNKRLRQRLAAEHTYHPDDESAIWISSTFEQYKDIMLIFTGINAFVWIIGIGTLLAGIMGVSNIMLVTITERTSEFGVRKALGAKPSSIVRLILTESVLITALFGYIGLVLGVAIMEVVGYIVEMSSQGGGAFGNDAGIFIDPTLDLGTAISATLVLIVAGLIAGYVPAYRAAQLKTIDALRYNK